MRDLFIFCLSCIFKSCTLKNNSYKIIITELIFLHTPNGFDSIDLWLSVYANANMNNTREIYTDPSLTDPENVLTLKLS